MDTGALSSAVIPILVILLLIAGILAGFYFIPKLWKKQSNAEIKQTGSNIRGLENKLKEARIAGQAYAPDDPEPYGSAATNLYAQIDQFTEKLHELQGQYGEVHQAVRHVDQYPPYQIFLTSLEWFQIRKQVKALRQIVLAGEGQASSLDQTLQKLKHQAWDTALQARQARQDLGETNQLIQYLKTNNASGDSYEKLLRQKSIIQIALDNIPGHFLSENEDALIDKNDKEGVVQVHQVLSDHHSTLQEINRQFKQWKAQYEDCQNLIEQVHQRTSSIRQKFSSAPPNLDLATIETRLSQVEIAYQALEDRLEQPDPDEFKTIAREASLLTRTAEDIDARFDKAVEQLSALIKSIRDLVQNVNQLTQAIGDLAKRETYPIDWDQHYAQLTALRKEVKGLGTSNDPRTPEQIEQETELVRQQNERLGQIEQAEIIISRQHQEVLALLETLNLEASVAWGLNTQRLADQVNTYDPENWAQKNTVIELSSSVDTLLRQLKETIPTDAKKPLKETYMAELVERLRQISEFYVNLQNQEDRVRHRFQELQALEESAEETLLQCRTGLKQVSLVVKSNPLLQKLAGNQADQLLAEGERISLELTDRSHGLVQRKYQSVNEYATRLETASNQWFATLIGAIQDQRADIGSRLNTLQDIGEIDEPAIAEGAKLLSQLMDTGQPNAKNTPLLPIKEISLQMKYRSEEWQRSLAIDRALEEIETPVLEAFQNTQSQREVAQRAISDAARLIPDQHTWPPSSQSLGTTIQEFNEIDKQWEALQQKPNRAMGLVSRLGDFASRYHTIGERAKVVMERAQDEQNRIRDLENQLNESIQMWRYQMRANSGSPQAIAEIQRLVDDAFGDLNQLKQQARQGSRPYQQVVQDLILLSRKVNSATVPIDDQQKMDINGETRINRGITG